MTQSLTMRRASRTYSCSCQPPPSVNSSLHIPQRETSRRTCSGIRGWLASVHIKPCWYRRCWAKICRALLVRGFRPVVVLPDKVGGEPQAIVGVRLAVGHGGIDPRHAALAGFVIAQQQFIPLFVVALGLVERDAILGMIGQAHAKAVGLDPPVSRALFAGTLRIQKRQQPAAGIAGSDIRIDARHELVVLGVLGLHAVQRLAVLGVGLASNRVADVGGRQQIAFVGGVDEHPAAIRRAGFHPDRKDPPGDRARHGHAGAAVQSLVVADFDLVRANPVVEDLQGRARLKGPHRIFARGGSGLAAVLVFLAGLPFPGRGIVVVLADRLVKFPRDAADGRLVPDVGLSQPAGGEPAQTLAGFDQHHGLAHPRRLDRGRDAAGRAPVNHDVVDFVLSSERGSANQAQGRSQGKESFRMGCSPWGVIVDDSKSRAVNDTVRRS